MTENSSNYSNLDIENSFKKFTDSLISLLDQNVEILLIISAVCFLISAAIIWILLKVRWLILWNNEEFITLKNRNDELTFEVKQLKEGKRVCFEVVPNKWKFIKSKRQCCENNCVNTDRPNCFCINGNGFIRIKNNTNIEYINCRNENEINKIAIIKTENIFNRPKQNSELSKCCLNCTSIFTLFYYEVKFQFENLIEIGIGFKKDEDTIISLWPIEKICYYFKNKTHYIYLPSFSIKNEDIIGCGLVYPPPKINNKLPYVFFTQNGKQIGKAILMKENYEYYQPYIGLKCCSAETNFGDDVKSKPFIYNISKHYVAEEFYKDEEFYLLN